MKKVIIQPQFNIQMANILEFGIEQFGARVTYNFYKNVMNQIVTLPTMLHIHPKNRFIESTEKKIFRNILVDKYAILYSVTTLEAVHFIKDIQFQIPNLTLLQNH